MKEIQKNQIYGERPNIVNMSIISKLIYRCNIMPAKIIVCFFLVDVDKFILRFIWKGMDL